MSFYRVHGLPGYVYPSFNSELKYVVILQNNMANPLEYTTLSKEDRELIERHARVYAVTKLDNYQPQGGMYDPKNKFI